MQDNCNKKKRIRSRKDGRGEEGGSRVRTEREKHHPYANYALTRKIVSRFTEGV